MAGAGAYHRRMPADYRKIFADNVKRLMEANPRFRSGASVAAFTTKPSDGKRVSARTINRIKNGHEVWPQLDTMIAIADAVKIPLWCMLIPGLDPEDPPGPQVPNAKIVQIAQRLAAMAQEEYDKTFRGNPEETGAFVLHGPGEKPRKR